VQVLVGFATAQGSTQGIAQRIAQGLSRRGLVVDLRSMGDVAEVSCYDAAVLGSAVHGGLWLAEGSDFVEHHAAVLRARPVWLFSVSTVGDEESMFPPRVTKRFRAMRGEPKEIAALRTAIGARGHRNFAGVIAPSDWPPTGRAFFRLVGGRYGDHRNWPAIDAWACSIAEDLGFVQDASSRNVTPEMGAV